MGFLILNRAVEEFESIYNIYISFLSLQGAFFFERVICKREGLNKRAERSFFQIFLSEQT